MSVESILLAAFTARLGQVRALGYHAVPWCSATFSGARHVFRLETEGVADINGFARDIAEADITIPRGFVAEIAVTHQINGNTRQIDVEALTIDA